jgi:HicB-like protein involved in pilus formation
MQMSPHVDAILADLDIAAQVGDDSVAQAARRLVRALEASLRVRLLEAMSEAASELNASLPEGHVDVRIAGGDVELAYVSGPLPADDAAPDEDLTSRITLRLPESLKARIETAAARQSVSVNTWLVRAAARGLDRPTFGNRLTGFAQS